MIFIKTLQKLLKQGLILQIMSQAGYYQKENIKKTGLIKDQLSKKIMK